MLAEALLLASVVSAKTTGPDPCVKKTKSGYDEPATWTALRDCQDKALDKYVSAHRDMSDAEAAKADDFQRAEVQDYLKRHPDRTADSGGSGVSVMPSGPAAAAEEPDIAELQTALNKEAGDGRNGLTPQMAGQIADFLQKKQGGESQDMQDLLQSLQRDGGNLSDESALRLKHAARDAKQAGLELNIDPKVRDWLLDPSTDPKVQLPPPGSN
jgi:hypothetical protein